VPGRRKLNKSPSDWASPLKSFSAGDSGHEEAARLSRVAYHSKARVSRLRALRAAAGAL
jgi:hypothetical protein